MKEVKILVDKLGESVRFFAYSLKYEQKTRELFLLTEKVWSEDNQYIIREYFRHISLNNSSNYLEQLEQASELFSDLPRGIALLYDAGVVYAYGIGDAELWLIRESKVYRLLHPQTGNSLSGWVQENDCYIALLGPVPQRATEMRLVRLSDYFNTAEQGHISLRSIKTALELNLHGGVIYFHKENPHKVQLSETGEIVSDAEQAKSSAKMYAQSAQKLHTFWSWLKSKFVSLVYWLVNKIPTSDKIYALEQNQERRLLQHRHQKLLFGVGLLLLISLVISIIYGLQQRKEIVWQEQFGNLIDEVQHKLSEGARLAELNPSRAKDMLQEAQSLTSTLEERGLDAEELQPLKLQLQSLFDIAAGKRTHTADVWYDLTIKREDMQGEQMDLHGSSFDVLDMTHNRVVRIGVEDKSADVIAGMSEMGQVQLLSKYVDELYVYGSLGLVRIDNGNAEVLFPPDPELGKISDMEVYSGNIYLLSNNGVWKHAVIEEGFSNKQQWLAEDVTNFSNGGKLVIDGFIWVSDVDEVRKYARGVEDRFNISGLSDPISSITNLYTLDESEFLYVLEAAKKRIVQINKETGSFVLQYESDSLTNATDFIVLEDQRMILVLAGDKVLQIPLE